MPMVPFTQFLRPNGERKETWIEMPTDVELLARRFIDEGGAYTSELLPRTNEVSLCAEFGIEDERKDVVCVIAQNGPDIPDAVEQLIRESFQYLQKIEMRE